MSHKVKVTVIDKKLYPELQEQYCMDPKSGACPCYNVGDEFVLIGSGSVVTKDIPSHVIAAGNPCKVIREITDKDKEKWKSQYRDYLQESGVN